MSYRNAPIHPFLRLIYALLRFTAWAGMSVFYRRRLVLGREHLDFDGPAIIVSNHPNTMMDPLNAGISIHQELFFLANYGLFKNPVSRWILTRLFCIPVKRKEDVAEGEARDNDVAFEKSFQHLEKNGLLYIAAEGVSWMNRYVRPFKAGAARIALGAERRNEGQLGVKIIPVGLSYETPNLFRSRMTVEYGAPIDPKSWAEADKQDHEKAVNDLTEEIQNKVSACCIDAGSEEGETFVNQTETLIRNSRPGFTNKKAYFFVKEFVVQNLLNDDLKNRFDEYFTAIQKAGLTDTGFSFQSNYARNPNVFYLTPLILLVISPLFLIGYVFWFLPCWLPWLLAKKMKVYVGYESNIKMLTGLFTFPLALWAGWKVAFWLFESHLWAWVALAVFVLCGYVAEAFMDIATRWWEWRAARVFQKQNPMEWRQFADKREEIMKEIHA